MAHLLLNANAERFYQQGEFTHVRILSPEKMKAIRIFTMGSESSAVLPEVENDASNQLQPLYHVILLNDEDHTYDYVVEMLQKIFGFSETRAFSHAVEVDTKGTTILLTCELEKAERKRDMIHAFGPDWRLTRSLGSMAAVVEPAAG